MTATTSVAAALTMVLLCSGEVLAQQPEPVEWIHAFDITSADKGAIARLARRLGIQQLRRVTFTAYLPSLCPFVLVESAATAEGNRRTWQELRLRREDWRACTRVPRFSTRGEGRWRGSRAELSTEESWRFAEGDWAVDVKLAPTVRYEDAQRIVLAIRHKTLVNRLAMTVGSLKLNFSMPEIDANEIVSISATRSDPRTYEVRTGRGAAGEVYEVRIEDSAVELHRVWTVLV